MTFIQEAEAGVIAWQHKAADAHKRARIWQDEHKLDAAIAAQHQQRYAYAMANAIRDAWLDTPPTLATSITIGTHNHDLPNRECIL